MGATSNHHASRNHVHFADQIFERPRSHDPGGGGRAAYQGALAEYLRDCGYRVFEAVDTVEAKAMLASWVRETHPHIEVIVTSGVVNITAKASDLRTDGAIQVKPYRYEALLQRIQTAVH